MMDDLEKLAASLEERADLCAEIGKSYLDEDEIRMIARELRESFSASAAREKALREALDNADVFTFPGDRSVRFERRLQTNGPDRWRVVAGDKSLNRNGDWVYEPMPSSITDEFLDTVRFDTLELVDTFELVRAALEGAPHE